MSRLSQGGITTDWLADFLVFLVFALFSSISFFPMISRGEGRGHKLGLDAILGFDFHNLRRARRS